MFTPTPTHQKKKKKIPNKQTNKRKKKRTEKKALTQFLYHILKLKQNVAYTMNNMYSNTCKEYFTSFKIMKPEPVIWL